MLGCGTVLMGQRDQPSLMTSRPRFLAVISQGVISGPMVLLLFGLSGLASPTVTIDRCHDGDTCWTTTGEAIRLACVDAPELTGPRASQGPAVAARDYLRQLVVGQEVLIRRIGQDRYGRWLSPEVQVLSHIGYAQRVRSAHRENCDLNKE